MHATENHRQFKASTPSTAENQIANALVRLSLRVAKRPEDEGDHHARMNVYLADLQPWPLEVALVVLNRWPERSQWWPTWHELEVLRAELLPNPPTLALPRVARFQPEGRTTKRHSPSGRNWDDFAAAMRKLRNHNVPMLCRDSLLAIGQTIQAKQGPNAENRGWV